LASRFYNTSMVAALHDESMKSFLLVLCLFSAQALFSASGADLSSLGFMSGCWAGSNGEERFEEMWTKPDSGSVLGVSRTMKGGKTTFTEYIQVRANAAGEITMYIQLKLAEKATPFKLVQADGKRAIFENPEHDFPKKIMYRVDGDGLFAQIEGPQGGKTVTVDYPMKRTSCK
jgi:hypothetical protein